MLFYSNKAEIGRALLLRKYNSIDVFVEDAACTNVYVRLVNRMLKGRGSITHVYSLGGRDHVIARCRADQAVSSRKRLYLIDADLDLLTGAKKERLANLHRLSSYCIENLLISERAVLEIASECSVDQDISELAKLLEVDEFLNRIAADLSSLFVVYAAVQGLGLRVETTSYSVIRLLADHSDPHSLSNALIRSRITNLLRLVAQNGKMDEYRQRRDVALRRVAVGLVHPIDFISGKSHLFPLIHLLLKQAVHFTDKQDRLKVRLASMCDLSRETKLGTLIRKIAA